MMTVRTIKLAIKEVEKSEFENLSLLLDLLKITNYTQDGFFNITYDDVQVYRKLNRSPGRKRKELNSAFMLDVEDVERMIDEQTAAVVAKKLGVSRRTLFRRLEKAKEKGTKYLY